MGFCHLGESSTTGNSPSKYLGVSVADEQT